MLRWATFLTLFLLSGCTSHPPRPLSLDHPGNPEAAPSADPTRPNSVSFAPLSETTTADDGDHPPVHAQSAGHEHAPNEAASQTAKPELYVCPMHPGVTSSNPDARCPKCGMALERAEKMPESHR